MRSFIWTSFALAIPCLAAAMVLRVPQDFITIQSAMNVLQDGDTILVAVGTYAEALIAPPVSFTLRGDVVPDTGDYPRPLVDPSSLPRADTLSCLILQGGQTVTIEDFAFRNGPEMDTIPRPRPGGISNRASTLRLWRCVFDSVLAALVNASDASGTVYLSDCHFRHGTRGAVRTGVAPLHAERCLFSGQGFWLVTSGSGSTFRECQFRDNRTGHLLACGGDSLLIESCVFGPYGPYPFSPVSITPRAACVIRSCIFQNCTGVPQVLEIAVTCPPDDPSPIEISDNIFRNFNGGSALNLSCQGNSPTGFLGTVARNVLRDGQSSGMRAAGIAILGSARLNTNRLTRLEPQHCPDVLALQSRSDLHDTVTLRNNLFDPAGLAASTQYSHMDAPWNWWGDSTGPYHATLNPSGQGAAVGDNVMFTPWHTDTTFLQTRPRQPLPTDFAICRVFPNPFNSEVMIEYVLNSTLRMRLEIFDLLGRRTATLVHETLRPGVHYATWHTTNQASGLYFARLCAEGSGQAPSLHKLVLLK